MSLGDKAVVVIHVVKLPHNKVNLQKERNGERRRKKHEEKETSLARLSLSVVFLLIVTGAIAYR